MRGRERLPRPQAAPAPRVLAADVRRGRPLEAAPRVVMERALGHRFADVRIHAPSDEAISIGAPAFTVGEDVHFSPGAYRPGTTIGDALLAHELAHVVQQREVGGSAATSPAALEVEADHAAAHAVLRRPGPAPIRSGGAGSVRLSRCGGARPWDARVGPGTALEVERLLRVTPVIRDYVGPQLDRGPGVVGHLHVLGEPAFARAYAAYVQTHQGLEERDPTKIGGFREGDEMTVADRSRVGDALHEAIHRFSHPTLQAALGHRANEGFTQYFTLEVLRRNGYGTSGFSSYGRQEEAARAMADEVGFETMAAAYFGGDVGRLFTAVGQARWTSWQQHMMRGDYGQAKAVFW